MRMKSAKLIRKFVDEVLSGDWKKFETFDVRTLQTSELYGCPGGVFLKNRHRAIGGTTFSAWGTAVKNLLS